MRSLLFRLAKGLALVVLACGSGLALGVGLSKLSGDDAATTPVAADSTTSTASAGRPTAATRTTATALATATTPRSTTTAMPTQTTTTSRQTGSEQVRVRVLGAVLRPAGEPSGAEPQDGEIVTRVRMENGGTQAVTIKPPVLRIGSVRTQLDPASLTLETQFGSLAGGETKAVTLKFQITGEATPKATRDRRARIEIAGGSYPLRLKLAAS